MKPLIKPGHREQPKEDTKKPLTRLGNQALLVALVAGAAAALLRFATALSGEKAVAARLIGLVMAAVAVKAIWRPDLGDGLLLTGVGILGVLVPIWAWQMPVGAAWILLMLGAAVASAGCWNTFRGDQELAAFDVDQGQPIGQD